MAMPADLSYDQKLVDSVVYLASLASETKAIDPTLDALREVTSSWDPATPLSNQSRTMLDKLVADLKTYLINDDPLRSFTVDSLDERLASKLAGMRKKIPPFLLLVVACLAPSAVIATLSLPFSLIQKISIATSAFLTLLCAVNIWLYFSSLSNFKPMLRVIFAFICTGTIFMALQYVHFTFIGVSDTANEPAYRFIGFPIISGIGFLGIYLGLTKYAKALTIQTRKTSIQLACALAIAVIICLVVAKLRNVQYELYFAISLWSIATCGTIALFACKITHSILKVVTPSYAKPLRTLYWFLLSIPPISYAFDIILMWVGEFSAAGLSASLISFAFPIILFLYSGYSFKRETSQ